jgi:hypothetical protein
VKKRNIEYTFEIHTVKVPTVLVKVKQQVVRLLLAGQDCCDAAQGKHSCLVQPAMCPGGIEQAGLIVDRTAAQHCQQAGVWQREQQGRASGSAVLLAILWSNAGTQVHGELRP